MALLVASLARSETQVAIYGTLLVLVLAGLSGCLMPRGLMPENMKQLSLITPHAWSLDAYNQLLLNPTPSLAVVGLACAVLAAFGVGFVLLAWLALRLE
jgi:ABC-type multidrug transport system permease subunit